MLEVHLELVAEVDFAGEGVFGDFARGAGDDDFALADDVGAVGGFEGFADVVVGDKDADAAFLEAGHGCKYNQPMFIKG